MQAFVASLTAALLFIHTVVGCCWHHAHCEVQGAPIAGAPVADHQPASCCHHHHHGTDSQQQEPPCKSQGQCEGSCNYVLPQKVKIEHPQPFAIDLLAVLPSLADHQIIAAAASRQALTPLSDWVPPLRTHLLHQVFLN